MNVEEMLTSLEAIGNELAARTEASNDPQKGNLQSTRHMQPETKALTEARRHLMRLRSAITNLDNFPAA